MTRPVITEESIGKPPVQFPCFIELNKSGTRIRIAFDGDDLPGALDRIDEALGVRAYAVNAFMLHCVKLTKEEKK